MPPRRPSPKPRPVEQPSTLTRLASIATDWKAIVGFVLLVGSGVAWAINAKYATKSDVAAVSADLQSHKEDVAVIRQAIVDFAETQKQMRHDQSQMMDWVRDIYQHPRR